MSTVELRFAALPGHVRTARMIAMAVARRAGVPSGALDEIRLAVGEACLRAVNVNRRRAPEDLVEVRMMSADGAFTVTVVDSGEPADDATPGPDGGLLGAPALLDLGLGARPLGDALAALPGDQEPGATGSALPPGIGLALIEGLVDDVEIRSRPDGVGTVVTMTWDTAAFIGGDLEGGLAAAGNPAF
ncbi:MULTISPECIES: ATP-binding protein [Pseudofrankia]|uniref:ATP-binding protein n=1 Tax=Pseudofrankia TaxID=2994363 RepID=UPI000234CE62|nr:MULTISPECIES: ATP-binding protein [Pseudofrankia]OHV32983.1 anti-sigma regulatory factor [Pseudofrankia sp. EUN1h]